MGEYSDIIKQFSSVAPSQAAANLDADPDAAAKAIDLSRSTGIPAPTINANLDQFQTQYKAKLANELIRGNSQLDTYIRSHPLAAQVSNDDYGNLDQLSRSMSVTAQIMKGLQRNRDTIDPFAGGAAEAGLSEGIPKAIKGWREGYGEEPLGSWVYNPKSSDLLNATALTFLTPLELAARIGQGTLGAVFGGASGFAAGAGQKIAEAGGAGPATAEALGREAGGYTEFKLTSPEGVHPGIEAFHGLQIQEYNKARATAQEGIKAWQEAKGLAAPYIDAGIAPPAGMHPLIDSVYAKLNSDLLAQLNEQLAKAQDSFTKERSPEMFQGFLNQHYENAEIGIDGRVVAELYPEGKIPTADDGLLGWVPGIEEKLAAARATDADVQVPMADWLAKVDPALAKTLNDDIRTWPGGITAREATEPRVERPPAIDAPIAQLRDYLGTEPMMSLGDRRVTLERRVEPPPPTEAWMDEHVEGWRTSGYHQDEPRGAAKWDLEHPEFDLKDDAGNVIGKLQISINNDGKQLYVDWIGGLGGWGPRDIGPSAIRDMLRQLKAAFPEAGEVTGHRVSGARFEADTWRTAQAHPHVKLDTGPEGANENRRPRDQGDTIQEAIDSEHGYHAYVGRRDVAQRGLQQHWANDTISDDDLLGLLNSTNPQDIWTAVELWANRAGKALKLSPTSINTLLRQMAHLEELLGPGGTLSDAETRSPKLRLQRTQARAQYDNIRQKFGLKPIGEGWSDAGFAWRDFGSKLSVPMSRDIALLRELNEKPSDYSLNKITREDIARKILKEEFGAEPEGQGRVKLPTIKLTADGTAPEGWGEITNNIKTFQDILNESHLINISHGYTALMKRKELWTPEETTRYETLKEELDKLTGGRGVEFIPVSRIMREGKTSTARGLFTPFTHDRLPQIMVNMFGPDTLGTGRHEAIHFLRYAGLIKPEEWAVLAKTAHEQGWVEKYGISERYSHLDPLQQLEEAVAEHFRSWMEGKDREGGLALDPHTGGVFQRMLDWWNELKAAWTKAAPNWEQLFEKIGSGEVGKREPQHTVMFGDQAIKFDLGPAEKDALQTQLDDLRASGTGLDAKSFGIIQKLIRERYENDLQAAMKRAETEQKKRQTDEWKGNYKDVRKEVEENIRQRPDVAADLFFGSGELQGHKLGQKYRIAADTLSEEQKAALPQHYYGKEGLPLDGMAHMFGFPDGDSMVAALAKYNAAKGDLTPQEMLAQVIKTETDRQMEARYGFLEKNILEDAKDQALSDTDINILAEEYHAAGMTSGQPTLDKAVVERHAFSIFNGLEIGQVDSNAFMQGVARHAREIERNLLAGDNASALIGMQKKLVSMMLAQHARRLEKTMTQFDKSAKQYSKWKKPGIWPEHLNFAQQILAQIGKPLKFLPENLASEIAAGSPDNLRDFIDQQNGQGRILEIWDPLFDASWRKPYNKLTVDEFNAVKGSFDSLIRNGRLEMKLEKAGVAADYDTLRNQLIMSLGQFPELMYRNQAGGRTDTLVPHGLRAFVAMNLKMETVLNRWDHYDPFGDWNQYVLRGLFDGAYQAESWKKEYAKRLKTILKDFENPGKTIANTIFRDPGENPHSVNFGPTLHMTREGLLSVMLNMGTEANFTKLGKGYGVERAAVQAWVDDHATAADWAVVRKLWDTFSDAEEHSANAYRQLGGRGAKRVPARKVQTAFGEIDGGYYPIIHHPNFEGKRVVGKDDLLGPNFINTMPTAGYVKERTGDVRPLALTLNMMPGRLGQVLHDAALRPALVNASKVFRDGAIRTAIRKHYGQEYVDQLLPYLRDVANGASTDDRMQGWGAKVSEFVRLNTISMLTGLNLGTVMKHGPTAWVQSMQEAGPSYYLRAVQGLFSKDDATGESNWQHAKKKFEEVGRRERHWDEVLGASTQGLTKGAVMPVTALETAATWRQKIIQWSAKPVALSDMASAVPLANATYARAIAEGLSEGDAVYLANRAVRRAHGSTIITDRAAIMRGGPVGQWLTSLMSFFNHIMNRKAEMIWKSGEMFDLAKEEGWSKASSMLPAQAAMMFSYVMWPAIVEHYVAGEGSDKESYLAASAKALVRSEGASWPVIREFTNAWLHGSDPAAGLFGPASKALTDFARDLGKKGPLDKDHAGRLIQDGMTLLGVLTSTPAALGKGARFLFDVNAKTEHPKDGWGWLVGLRFGTLKHHSKSWDDWKKGKSK